MIQIHITDIELFDNIKMEFLDTVKGGTFKFEHSLEAISKWESIWKVPFLNRELSQEESMDYFLCMCIDEGLTRNHLLPEVTRKLEDYMNDPYTATTIQNEDKSPSGMKVITSEVLYSYMVAGNIPFEADKWHINRLLMLIRVVALNQQEPKKMTQAEVLAQNRKLNEQRKKQLNTKG